MAHIATIFPSPHEDEGGFYVKLENGEVSYTTWVPTMEAAITYSVGGMAEFALWKRTRPLPRF